MFGILRTLLAFNVVLLHIFSIPALGNYSVSFFFLLSGFLMTLIMHETYGYDAKGFRIYWLNRILRLYPIYLVILSLTIAALVVFPTVVKHPDLFLPSSFIEWLANLTMLFPEIVPHRFEPRLVPPSWALTNELIFYLLISIGISKTSFRTYIWLMISVAYYVFTYYYYDIETYRYSAIFASSLPFALGASLYWLQKSIQIKRISFLWIIVLYLFFVLNALYASKYTPSLKQAPIYVNLVIAFVLVFLLYNFKINTKLKKWDTYVGYYSYPIYLAHYLAVIIYAGTIGYGVLEGSFKLQFKAFIPYMIFLIPICVLLVHLIDIKVDAIKKKLKAKQLPLKK